MTEYLTAFGTNLLPLPLWGVAVLWRVIYLLSYALRRKQEAVLKALHQNFIAIGKPTGRIQPQSWRLVCVHVLLTALIFTSAYFLGRPALEFLAGGWLVTSAVSIPLALRKILFNRALSAPGAALGSVTLSYELMVKSIGFELLAAAAFILILGLCLSHLALLGGAFFVGATGFGYIRKARQVQPTPANTVEVNGATK